MMSQEREEFAYLQVDRPVLSGAEKFLAQADYIGRQVLGEVYRASVTEFTAVEDGVIDLEERYNEKHVPESQLSLERAGDLRLILLHRRIPMELSSRYRFSYHVGQFDNLRKPVYPLSIESQPGRYKPVDLYTQLDQVSYDRQVDPDELVVMCDKIDIVYEGSNDGVLALYPKTGPAHEVIQTQVSVAEKRLEQQTKKIAALDGSSTTGAIRLGTIPKDVDRGKNKVLLDELKEYLPLRVVIGGVSSARSRQARRHR